MKLLQNNVLGGNKLNCFKATQVLEDPTQILIWGPKQLKVLPDKSRGIWSFRIKGGAKFRAGGLKFQGGPMKPNDAMFWAWTQLKKIKTIKILIFTTFNHLIMIPHKIFFNMKGHMTVLGDYQFLRYQDIPPEDMGIISWVLHILVRDIGAISLYT